ACPRSRETEFRGPAQTEFGNEGNQPLLPLTTYFFSISSGPEAEKNLPLILSEAEAGGVFQAFEIAAAHPNRLGMRRPFEDEDGVGVEGFFEDRGQPVQ